MIHFWLNRFGELLNIYNFTYSSKDTAKTKQIKFLNALSIIIIIVGTALTIKHKQPYYFGIVMILLSLIVLIYNFSKKEGFENNVLAIEFSSGVRLLRKHKKTDKQLYITGEHFFKIGDTIFITQYDSEGKTVFKKINIIENITLDGSIVILSLRNELGFDFDNIVDVKVCVPFTEG